MDWLRRLGNATQRAATRAFLAGFQKWTGTTFEAVVVGMLKSYLQVLQRILSPQKPDVERFSSRG